jgi:hypothetical protein
MIQKTVRDLEDPLTSTYLLLGFSFTPTGTSSRATGALRRGGTVVRSPMDGRKDKGKTSEDDMTAQEVLPRCSLHVSAFLLSELGLWPSLGADLPSDTSRRRVHR